jgi:stage 0 sporulation regulatory protein
MAINEHDLLLQIESCRIEMISRAMKTSFSNAEVLDLSVKLDHLLNKYEAMKSKTKKAAPLSFDCRSNLFQFLKFR